MLSRVIVFCIIFAASESLVYIENVAIDFNPSIANASVSFVHDENGNSITNLTMQSFVIVTKMLVYFKVTMDEGQKASGFKRELVNIVVDVEKLFKGSQVNPIVRGFIDALKKFMDFEAKFPAPPVRRKLFFVELCNLFNFYFSENISFCECHF